MKSEQTEKNYRRLLGYLESKEIYYKNITDGEKYIESLRNIEAYKKNRQILESTVKQYIAATLWYYKKNEKNGEIKKLEAELKKINENIREEVSKNKLIRNQVVNYVEWDKILWVYEQIKQNYTKTKDKHKSYVLLSCYVLMAPRRLKDYAKMYVSENEENLDEANNYYIKNGGRFIFNNYKTQKIFKQQKIGLTEEHKTILNEYIDKYNITGSLFESDENMIKGRLMRLFTKHLDKQISVNILRHSFITWLNDTGKLNVLSRRKIADIMAHDMQTQDSYYKNLNKDVEDDGIVQMINFY